MKYSKLTNLVIIPNLKQFIIVIWTLQDEEGHDQGYPASDSSYHNQQHFEPQASIILWAI